MGVLSKDIVWRPLAIAFIALAAWGGWLLVESLAQQDVIEPTQELATSLAQSTSRWMRDFRTLGANLAEDGRVRRAFNEGDWKANGTLLRRTLYEFSYINNIESAYAVNPHADPQIIKTSNAPKLPSGVFALVNADQGSGGVMMMNVDGQPHLLVAEVVTDALGNGKGYMAFLSPMSEALNKLAQPSSLRVGGVQYGLLRQQKGNRMVGVLQMNAPAIMVLDQRDTQLPIFGGDGGLFLHNGKEVVAAAARVPANGQWTTLAWADLADAQSGNTTLKALVLVAAGVLILVVLLVPGKGAYGSALKKMNPFVKKPVPPKPAEGDFSKQAKEKLSKTGMVNPSDLRKPTMATPMSAPQEKEEEKAKPNADPLGLHAEREKKENKSLPPSSGPKRLPPKLEALGKPKKTGNKLFFSKGKYNETGELTDNILNYIIRTCLTEKRIKLLYQPVFDAATQNVVMHEIFLRLVDEDGTVIEPAKFIPVAEKNGLMDDVDRTVMDVVVDKHFRSGGKDAPTPLLLNLSGNSFDSIGYIHSLMRYVSDGLIPAGSICFELRSEEIIGDRKAMDFINECRDVGIRFGIDYFGGGQQVLQVSKSLKFDYVKVSGFRFDNVATNKEQQKEMAVLAATAKKLDIPVVLEKIETPLMAKLASKMGYPLLQGYHFAEPADDFHGAASAPAAPQEASVGEEGDATEEGAQVAEKEMPSPPQQLSASSQDAAAQ